MLVDFHLHLYAQSAVLQQSSAGTISFNGHDLPLWQITHVDQTSMEISFEQLINNLSQLPRMFCELDGSFVWRGEWKPTAVCDTNPQPNRTSDATSDVPTSYWQIDGMIYDTTGRVCRIELKGQAAQQHLRAIIECCEAEQWLVAHCIELDSHSEIGKFVLINDLLQAWK
jgi:hypothetical protein